MSLKEYFYIYIYVYTYILNICEISGQEQASRISRASIEEVREDNFPA